MIVKFLKKINSNLMKSTFFLVLISFVFVSCRKNFATFQQSQYENFEHKKSIINISKLDSKTDIDNTIYAHSKSELKKIESNTNLTVENSTIKATKIEKKSAKSISTIINKTPTTTQYKIFKQKRRGDNWWENINVRLKIGAILLGIAIIFALLSIEVLAIVFGLVAAYMIIRGLKKMW
jgi:Na+-transporting NADH:ubiquinone oxidoreductase subunit NqrC